MAYTSIRYEENKKDFIGLMTLDRPDKRNALGREAEEEIIACLQDAAKRAEVKVIILKATGEVFCSGHDRLEIVRQPADDIRRLIQTSYSLVVPLRTVPQCIIEQVQGIAMAGGCHHAA